MYSQTLLPFEPANALSHFFYEPYYYRARVWVFIMIPTTAFFCGAMSIIGDRAGGRITIARYGPLPDIRAWSRRVNNEASLAEDWLRSHQVHANSETMLPACVYRRFDVFRINST